MLKIKGFWPDWCISTIYHAWDTPFWSATPEMLQRGPNNTFRFSKYRAHFTFITPNEAVSLEQSKKNNNKNNPKEKSLDVHQTIKALIYQFSSKLTEEFCKTCAVDVLTFLCTCDLEQRSKSLELALKCWTPKWLLRKTYRNQFIIIPIQKLFSKCNL